MCRLRPIALLCVLVLASGGTPHARASTVQEASDPARHCAGALKEMDPIELALSGDDDAIAAGGATTIHARIHAWNDVDDARMTLRAEGPVELAGASEIAIGTLVAGADYALDIPVRYTGTGNAAVHVTVVAGGSQGEQYRRNEGLFTVYRDGRAHAGMGGYIYVGLEAIQQDLAAGRMSEDEARAATRALAAPQPGIDELPREGLGVMLTPEGGLTLPEFAAAPSDETSPPDRVMRGGVQRISAANITVQGQVNWLDENSNSHPCYGCTVEVRDDELIGSELVTAVATNTDGAYSFVVDNDDGPLQGGRDIFVRVRAVNSVVGVRPSGGGDYYSADSPIHDNVADGSTTTENFTFDNTGTNSAFGVETAASYVAAYTYFLNGNAFLSFLPVEWPGGSGSDYNGSRIRLGTGDRWDWDVLHHEYGHYVMDTFNFEANPGGAHSSSQCDAVARNSKDTGIKLAWGEGWPTYFGISGQNVLGLSGLGVPRVGDSFYQDLEDGSLQYDLEFQQPFGGEDNERAVMNTFWDLFDSNSDSRDAISVNHLTLFNRVDAADAQTLSAAWAALRAPLSSADDLLYGGCSADHLIGPTLNTPAAAFLLTPSNVAGTSFNWDPRVGCGAIGPGDNFDLVFYRASDKAKILTIGGLGSASHTLSGGEFASLAGSTHQYLWAVEGRSTASPATGPYLGENFAITVDRPPVANAGPDQLNVECASHTTTDVHLNGAGSSDPDGDALTYTWSAAGVTFDNNHSATPTGQFDKGTTVVTLTVSDGLLTDQDQMTVRVVDTTPPTIACPAPITVECSELGGTPATDPAIAAFLAGASATDICDASPALSNDAPAFFPHGITPVEFTATDDDLNSSHCTADVHVVDTTPPTIAVSLDRTALWPPNHKLSAINATVTVSDICDPNPYFVLESITSNEPVDGLGDGDTAPDIVDADLGTADVAFQLRSERGGVGVGRKYTIVYTAYDHDGNHASQTVYVTVPHDLAGGAMASEGFDGEGTGFAAEAEEFVLVVPSGDPSADGDLVAGTGGAIPDPVSEVVDATDLDLPHIYVGNSRGAVAPLRTRMLDVNADGSLDVACFYDVAAVNALRSASTEEDGPIGLHFTSNDRRNFLVADVFSLGQPVALPPEATAAGASGPASAGTASAGGKSATGATASMAADPSAQGLPATQAPAALVARTQLAGVFPNPFGHDALVGFELAAPERVSLEVYDLRGARVRTLASGAWGPGRYQLRWNGDDLSGRPVPGGIYLIRFDAGTYRKVEKAVLMR